MTDCVQQHSTFDVASEVININYSQGTAYSWQYKFVVIDQDSINNVLFHSSSSTLIPFNQLYAPNGSKFCNHFLCIFFLLFQYFFSWPLRCPIISCGWQSSILLPTSFRLQRFERFQALGKQPEAGLVSTIFSPNNQDLTARAVAILHNPPILCSLPHFGCKDGFESNPVVGIVRIE